MARSWPVSPSVSTPNSKSSPKFSPHASPKASPKKSPKLTSKLIPRHSPKNPWKSFYLLKDPSKLIGWDPWPVKRFEVTPAFKAAQKLINQRNEENLDNLVDRIVLLPASSSIPYVHGGTSTTDLYSIRSPRNLPVRIHLWITARGKVMVRKNSISMPLPQLLDTFKISTWEGPFKNYVFWRRVNLSQAVLAQLEIPKRFHQMVYERWWSVNIFRFMDLPPELRDMILGYAIGDATEPYSNVYRPSTLPPLPSPNANLLLASKQLRSEAISILFSQVTFIFRKHGQLMRFFECISKPSFYALRSLELNFDHRDFLDVFGAQVFRHSPTPGFSTADYYFRESLFSDRLRLRHIRFNFPHPREHIATKHLRYTCQRTVCQWIWAAARRCLRDVPHVEFEGCIKDDQKEEWLETLAVERKGILTDPKEIKLWQKEVWSAE